MKEAKSCGVCTDFKTLAKKDFKAISVNKLECPPDKSKLGQSTWTFLHTMAAYYPEKATLPQQKLMKSFIDGLAEFYPCEECASHLQSQLVETPPKVKSNIELSDWFCQIHNQVNILQGKPEFDCSKVFERWRTGSKSCFQDGAKDD
jgi:mitochondrial FAD-linked sulfhydryl oxidase